ncbi:hypothetical protein ACR77J_07360 [Tissierella praeacuta]|uniref:hypothetical protein n=1 Tax=Tissierella praeacuta TaxID=43131 RepID=UPI003DA33875
MNRTTKAYNQKVSLFNEDGKTYLGFEYDVKTNSAETVNFKIHKIDLSNIDISIDRRENRYSLTLDVIPVKDEILVMTDITPVEEMTIKEIEKELGRKIKIVD